MRIYKGMECVQLSCNIHIRGRAPCSSVRLHGSEQPFAFTGVLVSCGTFRFTWRPCPKPSLGIGGERLGLDGFNHDSAFWSDGAGVLAVPATDTQGCFEMGDASTVCVWNHAQGSGWTMLCAGAAVCSVLNRDTAGREESGSADGRAAFDRQIQWFESAGWTDV